MLYFLIRKYDVLLFKQYSNIYIEIIVGDETKYALDKIGIVC